MSDMLEVVIDSIRVSLMSQQRIVILREVDAERYLPIWIGPCEAEAITIELQDTEISRPMTHDLLKNIVEEMGAHISHIMVNDLRDSVFYARLVLDVNGEQSEIDCRPSDAIAVAVRAKVPIYINEDVLEQAGVKPEPDIIQESEAAEEEGEVGNLDAFSDFLDTLDFDDFEGEN